MRRSFLGASVTSVAVAVMIAVPAFAYQNGHLPQSELRPIYHPSATVYLQKDAAAAWNAMRAYCRARGVDIYPNGPNSAYRTVAQQVLMKKLYGSNAATPGTSNHGLGLAVDVATHEMRKAIDKWGAQFGWSKKWSDASWEWWHIKYKAGVWHGKDPGPNGSGAQPAASSTADAGLPPPALPSSSAPSSSSPSDTSTASRPADSGSSSSAPSSTNGLAGMLGPKPMLSKGDSGDDVRALQRELKRRGYAVSIDGDFGPRTVKAVKAFQKHNKLKADGIVGASTWKALQAERP